MKKILYILITFIFVTFSVSSLANSEGESMYSALGCASCHGANGRSSDDSIPSLAGKDVDWIV
jgi:cytochrome c553